MMPAPLTAMLTQHGPIVLDDHARRSLREWFDKASVEQQALWVTLCDETIDARSAPAIAVGGAPRSVLHTALLARELNLGNLIGAWASQVIRDAATAQHPLREEALLALALGIRGDLTASAITPEAVLLYDAIAQKIAPRCVRATRAPEGPAGAPDDPIFRVLVPITAALAAFALVCVAVAVAIAWRGGL